MGAEASARSRREAIALGVTAEVAEQKQELKGGVSAAVVLSLSQERHVPCPNPNAMYRLQSTDVALGGLSASGLPVARTLSYCCCRRTVDVKWGKVCCGGSSYVAAVEFLCCWW